MSTFNSQLGNDPIRKYQHELNAMSRRAESLRPIVKACEEAIQRSEMKGTGVSLKTVNNVRVIVAIMTVPTRMEELLPLFRELAKEGIHTNKTKPFTDHNYMGLFGVREYDCGQVQVNALLMPNKEDADSESGCRIVQTGVKEVPVFELVCPDKPSSQE